MQRTQSLPVQPSPLTVVAGDPYPSQPDEALRRAQQKPRCGRLTVAATFAAVLSPAGIGALHRLEVALAPERTQPTPAQMTAAAAEREVYATRADQAAVDFDFRAGYVGLPQHERDLAVACAATARRNAAGYRAQAAKLRAGSNPWAA